MNKLVSFVVVMFVVTHVFAEENVSLGANNYCLIDNNVGEGKCFWCAAKTSTAPGNCRQGYALCYSESEEIMSLYDRVVPEGGTGFYAYSCTSDGWTQVRNSSNCDFGEYWDVDAYTCLKCPGATEVSGIEVFGTTRVQNERPDITACFLEPKYIYVDGTGEYILNEPCFYSE